MAVHWVGGEDEALLNVGGCAVSTLAGTFITGTTGAPRARCSLQVPGQLAGPQARYWGAHNVFSLANFWMSCRCSAGNALTGNATAANFFLIRFLDATGVVRLRLIGATTQQGPTGDWVLQKVNAAGAATTLATSTAGFATSGGTDGAPAVKFDFQVDYAVAGQFVWYVDSVPVLTFSGDVTTDGITALAGFDLGQGFVAGGATTTNTYWSECIISDADSRSLALHTLPPTGAGAASQWNGSASGSTVNEITLNDTDGIDTGSTGQIELFTQAGTLAAPFIVGIGVSARVITTAGQPQHVDLVIRQSGSNYASADLAAGTSFGNVQNFWATDPSTGLTWAAISGMQIGTESKA